MEVTNLVVAIDDLHPEQGWGCEGDIQVEYLSELNKMFGVKFNLFSPSYYHNDYPLTKDWVDFWKQFDWIELSNHGHFHDVSPQNKQHIGEQEFLELSYSQAEDRIKQSLSLWKSCGHIPNGFRSPGWGINQESADVISKHFKWVAKHEQINRDIKFNTKCFVGCDGINESDNINLYDNTFMFQSHIAGDWNDNVWSEDNFNHFQMVVDYLKSQYDLNFVTISELI